MPAENGVGTRLIVGDRSPLDLGGFRGGREKRDISGEDTTGMNGDGEMGLNRSK